MKRRLSKYSVSGLELATLICIDIAFLGFLLLIFISGSAVDWYLGSMEVFYNINDPQAIKDVLHPVSICAGIGALVLLFCLHILMTNVIKDKPFIMQNVKLLRVAGIAAVFIALCYLPMYPLFKIHIALFISVVFVFIALVAFVLSNLFKRAVEIKTENDFTI